MTAWDACTVFGLGLAVDVLATLMFHYTQQNKEYSAATVNVLVQGLWLFVFVDVAKEPVIAVPYLFGIWVGGVLGVKLKKHLERSK